MKIEVLYFDGCPNHEALLPRLRELLASTGVADDIGRVKVEDADAAERERFLGSPTVRIDRRDVEPGADQRSDLASSADLFAHPTACAPLPQTSWVLAALQRAQAAPR